MAIAQHDPRPIAPHAYAEGVRVMRGRDGRSYRLCSGCGRPRNAPQHRGFATPTHATLTDDQRHPFAPSGIARPNARGRRLPICAVCNQPNNSARHRGPGVVGSTAPGLFASTPRAAMAPADPLRANHGYPFVSPDRHPFAPGGGTFRDGRGYLRQRCASCEQPANSPRHRPGVSDRQPAKGHRAIAPVAPIEPTPKLAVATPYETALAAQPNPFADDAPAAPPVLGLSDRDRHPYQLGTATTVDRAGRKRPLCARCGLIANAQRHRQPKVAKLALVAQTDPGPQSHRSPPTAARSIAPDAAARIKAPPAELALLAIAIDTTLALPEGAIDVGLWVRLVALRATLDVPRFATLAPQLPELDDSPGDDSPENGPSPATTPHNGQSIPRPSTGPAATGAVLRGIRSDKVRLLVKRAIAQGWDATKTGSGHIALDRGAHRVIVSATGSSRGGHWFANVRAEAKRAGIDVTGI